MLRIVAFLTLLLSTQLFAPRQWTKLETCFDNLTKADALNLGNYQVLGEGLVHHEVDIKSMDPKVTVLSVKGRTIVTGKACAQDSDETVLKTATSMLRDAKKKMFDMGGISFQTSRQQVTDALNSCAEVEDVQVSSAAKNSLVPLRI